MSNVLTSILSAEFFFSIIRITSPILFATLGAVIVEKAGISNIVLLGDGFNAKDIASGGYQEGLRPPD